MFNTKWLRRHNFFNRKILLVLMSCMGGGWLLGVVCEHSPPTYYVYVSNRVGGAWYLQDAGVYGGEPKEYFSNSPTNAYDVKYSNAQSLFIFHKPEVYYGRYSYVKLPVGEIQSQNSEPYIILNCNLEHIKGLKEVTGNYTKIVPNKTTPNPLDALGLPPGYKVIDVLPLDPATLNRFSSLIFQLMTYKNGAKYSELLNSYKAQLNDPKHATTSSANWDGLDGIPLIFVLEKQQQEKEPQPATTLAPSKPGALQPPGRKEGLDPEIGRSQGRIRAQGPSKR